ncbi:hypothetical protein [Haloferula sargassicola]|uniref:Uncharacterized protein n=1 Tax=Haloferula sargassicola TaxID=490096 RepID=A0ABP9UMX5_9BACT
MKPSLLPLLAALAVLPARAETDLGFAEKFADPATRTEALSELVPGTRDWFFHTALDQQLRGDATGFAKTLADWRAASERKQSPVDRDGLDSLATRELLLRYESDPEKCLTDLARTFHLKFEDARPDARAVEKLPDALDPQLVSDEAFEQAAAREVNGTPWRSYREERLLASLDQLDTFTEPRLRYYLSTLRRADHPGIVRLVARGLALDPPVAFGQSPLHEKLTLAQLDELLQLQPGLNSSQAFVTARLRKMRRHTHDELVRQPELHLALLQRLREATNDLPPALISLRAHILFHLLRLERETGEPKLDDFLAYLAIPRRSHELLATDENADAPRIDLSEEWQDITDCRPIGDDTPLIRDLLYHFLATTDSADRFAPFIPHHLLTPIHARARLLAGADPERWGKRLEPSEFADLRDRTLIEFAPGRPDVFDAESAVSLRLDLKNTPELHIRIHELDLPGILRRHGRQPEVDLDLAGLVAHHTRTLVFEQPPLVLHREKIDLPELAGPGAWIVEFVSEGHSSRALIRKGSLVPYLEPSASGQVLRIFDEHGETVTGSSLTLGTETFTADQAGLISIPDSDLPAAGPAVLSRGRLASLVEIGSRQDRFQLATRFHVDREQLRADAEARARIQLQLSNHGIPVDLDRIENARLTLAATFVSGVTTEHVVSDDLQLAPVFTVPFQVPADSISLTLRLDATVVPREKADPVELNGSATFHFNSLLKDGFAHAHLTATDQGHFLELRGRNGEPLPERAIDFRWKRDGFSNTIDTRLRTASNGRIELGALDGIVNFTASLNGKPILEISQSELRPVIDLPASIRIASGETIRLPLEGSLDRLHYSFLELGIDDRPKADRFDALRATDGQLEIAGLSAGRYSLATPGSSVSVHVLAAEEKNGLLLTPSLIVPHQPAELPVTLAAAIEHETLTLRLARTTANTRVHLIGTRFLETPFSDRPLIPVSASSRPTIEAAFIPSGYLTDQTLDEETQYILRRRSLNHYPGTLLPRAGLLAHRWSEEESTGVLPPPMKGEAGRLEPAPSRDASRSGGTDPFSAGGGGSADGLPDYLDYLSSSSEVRYDLTPAEDGTIALPLAGFERCQSIRVVITDRDYYERRIIPLPESELPLRDRRLARPLDPEKHHVGTRRAAALMQGAEAVIDNMLDADWRAFTTLKEAHGFLYGATRSERLRDMAGMLDWPEFDEQSKLAFWSDHACHELHLFLSRRDPEFFAKYVKPMLEQKLEPTFIDDYLLGRDLTAYLRPFAWDRLNAAEKALLARALPDAKARIVSELENRWQLEAPAPEQEARLFTQTLRGTDLATSDSLGMARNEASDTGGVIQKSAGSSYVLQKLKNIVIPVIDFEDTSVEEAIDFLRVRSIELDTIEADPSKKGINFFLRRPRGGGGSFQTGVDDGGYIEPGDQRIAELRLRNVPLSEALTYICEATRLRWSVDDFAVTIKPATEVGEDLFTRSFRVPPDFLARISGYGADDSGVDDPIAVTGDRGASALAPRMSIIDALKANGVKFPEDSAAQFRAADEMLIVRSTPTNLDLIEQIVSATGVTSGSGGAGLDPGDSDPFAAPELPNSVGGSFYFGRQSWSGDRSQTRIWSESNYDHHRSTDTGESLIPLNAFWLDLAKWDGNGPFLSPHFNACTHSHNEALMCLALLDLPFSAERPEVHTDGPTLRVKAREPMLLFYKDTRETDQVAPESPVLVRQTFHRLDDRFRTEAGRQIENTLTGDFRTGTAYGSSLVVTNPTGAGRRIDVLAQIPAGAIPLSGKDATLSETRELPPYGVLTFDLAFYFPEPGDFSTYPLHVAEGKTILATGPQRTLHVTADDPVEDKASWKVIARDGTDEDVLARLRSENLHAIDLSLIAWRLRERGFYNQVIATLRDRLMLPQSIARYAFLHGDTATMGAWIEAEVFPQHLPSFLSLGDFLTSPVLDVRPTVHRGWQSLEFDPLVNPRAHQLGDNPRFHQDAVQSHYRDYLDQLAWKPAPSGDDQLHLTWFLFLQDRIGEALDRFAEIDRSQVATTRAYDYLHALALFHQSKPGEAAAIAAQYAELPPGPWAERFHAVISQAAEIAKLTDQPDSKDSNAAPEKEALQLELGMSENGKLRISGRGQEQVELSLYQIDLEMLFSRNPFLQEAGELPGTRPNRVETVATDEVDLPSGFQRGNVLVSAESGTAKTLRILDSRDLEIACRRADPVLQVRAPDGAPISAAYVKVYCERAGEAEFLKDGYTDLRGKFDYRTRTDDLAPPSGRIAILVTHPDHGCRTLVVE